MPWKNKEYIPWDSNNLGHSLVKQVVEPIENLRVNEGLEGLRKIMSDTGSFYSFSIVEGEPSLYEGLSRIRKSLASNAYRERIRKVVKRKGPRMFISCLDDLELLAKNLAEAMAIRVERVDRLRLAYLEEALLEQWRFS